MRRPAIGVVLVALVLVVASPPARATTSPPDAPFVLSQPGITWPCEPQAVFIDTATAPSPWHVQVVRDALVRFTRASGRSWPVTDDRSAPVRVRWYDPGHHEGALTVLGADASHYRGADVQLSPAIARDWLFSTVLHELGHVDGLDHVADPAEVMGLYPSTPHTRYEVGDLVGFAVANRGCR